MGSADVYDRPIIGPTRVDVGSIDEPDVDYGGTCIGLPMTRVRGLR